MTFSASSRIHSSATTYTILFNGSDTTTPKTVRSDTPLSASAAKTLAGGLGNFVAAYGTHFVAEYVYGKACKLSYNMKFSSLDMKLKFATTYSASESELGFSDSLSTTLSNALQVSDMNCTVDVGANCIGFDLTPPTTMQDPAKVVAAYGAAGSDSVACLSDRASVAIPVAGSECIRRAWAQGSSRVG